MAAYVVTDYWVAGYAEGDDDAPADTALFIDPKYEDASAGREWGNTRARSWANTQGGRGWGNDR